MDSKADRKSKEKSSETTKSGEVTVKSRSRSRATVAKFVRCHPRQFRQKVQELTRIALSSSESPLQKDYESLQHVVGSHEEFQCLPIHLKLPFMYCSSLFPLDYEFSKDKLVQLWIAEGLIVERIIERLEDTGSAWFDSLLELGFIVPSRLDHNLLLSDCEEDWMLYKVNEAKSCGLKKLYGMGSCLRRVDGNNDFEDGFELTNYLSVSCKTADQAILKAIKQCSHLRTLLWLPGYGSVIKQISGDLFLRLNKLRTLDLSSTLIFELPNSIGNVKPLRYLDVSETPIKRLPETIDCLYNLQTLKLKGCLDFARLPKGTRKLVNLRHLDLDIVRQLVSMPSGIGNLINLQTLSAFLVGRDDECGIGELKDMNDLSGSFSIWRLENVSEAKEAKKSALIEKKYLHRLELRWSVQRNEKVRQEEEVLEYLRPHSGLKELSILYYGGSKLPSWISDPSFADLVAVRIHNCRNCQQLPTLGALPSLKRLSVTEMNGVKEINHQFCGKDAKEVQCAFPKLERLVFDDMTNLENWMGLEDGDLPFLNKLIIKHCPKLVGVPSLSCLKSLNHLQVTCCPELSTLTKEKLPISLQCLIIKNCPKLKERCNIEEGQDWNNVAHVPAILIDDQEISSA